MCTSRPKVPAPQPAPPMPVNTSQTVGEELSPQLVTADEQDIKKKNFWTEDIKVTETNRNYS